MALAQRYRKTEKIIYTEEEYFEFERTSIGHWEFVGGEIRAMSGGTANHSTIAVNIIATLRTALLPKGCRVFGSDMKVHTGDGVNTFPDAAVVCGPLAFHRGRTDLLANPLLIVEVLSDSTEAYDWGDKFRHYQSIPSLTDYLLVSQDEALMTLFTRREDKWHQLNVAGIQGSVYLPSVETTLALTDVYALIELPIC